MRLTESEGGAPVYVCQFNRGGILFSRLLPYLGWDEFEPEAMRFWQAFIELGKPNEVARLSVRYISQIKIRSLDEVREYTEAVCEPLAPIGLSSNRFFHQDTMKVGEYPYIINLIRAVQTNPTEKPEQKSLIVDITVSTTDSLASLDAVPDKLKNLRYVKNKVFFELMKDAEQKFGSQE